jgi:hypothetical protein
MHWTQFFGGLMNFFDDQRNYPDVFANTSESSNFLPFWILAAPLTLLGFRQRKTASEPGPGAPKLPALLVGLALFLLCVSCYQIVGYPGWLAAITGFGFSTESRSVLAGGLAGMLFLIVSLRFDYRRFVSLRFRLIALAAAAIGISIYLIWNRTWNPAFLTVGRSISLGTLAVALSAGYLLMAPRLFAFGLAAVLLWNNFLVNPISQGLPSLLESTAMRHVERVRQADPDALWAAYERSTLPQFIMASGANVLNGIKVLPPLRLLEQIDPDGRSRDIYNRYAYIVLRLPRPGERGPHFEYSTPDTYRLFVEPTDPALRAAGLKYVVFRRRLAEGEAHGLALLDEMPESKIWIYQIL